MSEFDTFLAAAHAVQPLAAVVLGSGLGAVAERVTPAASVPFAAIPGFPAPTVHGHSGRFVVGDWAGVPVVVQQGRVHFYEGHPWERVTAGVRLLAQLGVRTLVLTNAAGGIRDDLNPGDLMGIERHIKLLGESLPVATGKLSPYAPSLLARMPIPTGCYAALTGPCYETPAEIRALRIMGADAVGMSTAVEAETAAALGLMVAAVSCVTNKAAGLSAGVLDHGEVQEVASRADVAGRLANLLAALVVEPPDPPAAA